MPLRLVSSTLEVSHADAADAPLRYRAASQPDKGRRP
jgi:hypothetical protein